MVVNVSFFQIGIYPGIYDRSHNFRRVRLIITDMLRATSPY